MPDVFSPFSYPEKRLFMKPGIKWREGNFYSRIILIRRLELKRIRLNVDTRINRSISDKIDDSAVKIFIYF